MTAPPIGLHCWPVPLDDGRYAVLSRQGARGQPGSRQDGEFSGAAPFDVQRGEQQTTVIGKRTKQEESPIDRRFPWVPSLEVATGINGLPNVPPASTDFYTSYAIEASPAAGLFRETYGVDHFYFLVIEIVGPADTQEVFADSVQTGDTYNFVPSSFVIGSGQTLVTTATLYVDSTRVTTVATATHTYTAA